MLYITTYAVLALQFVAWPLNHLYKGVNSLMPSDACVGKLTIIGSDYDWQITMTLHFYRSRRFQWTWFGVNPPTVVVGFRHPHVSKSAYYAYWYAHTALITTVIRPMWPQWANNHDFQLLQAKPVPMNLIWDKSAQCWRLPASTSFQERLLRPLVRPCGFYRLITMACTYLQALIVPNI